MSRVRIPPSRPMNKNVLQPLISEGLSTRELGQHFDLSQTTIRYWLSRHKLKTNPRKRHKCKCGETDPAKFYGRKTTVCSACHNKDVIERGKQKHKWIVEQLGGQCIVCGYDTYLCSLAVHHLDPMNKDPNFSSHRGWSEERILEELKDCVLLCGNCHPAVHAGLIILPNTP